MQPDGLDFLEACAKPIHVISVCGVAREGKSALCTMLMRLLSDTQELDASSIRFSSSYSTSMSPQRSSAMVDEFLFQIGEGTKACTGQKPFPACAIHITPQTDPRVLGVHGAA